MRGYHELAAWGEGLGVEPGWGGVPDEFGGQFSDGGACGHAEASEAGDVEESGQVGIGADEGAAVGGEGSKTSPLPSYGEVGEGGGEVRQFFAEEFGGGGIGGGGSGGIGRFVAGGEEEAVAFGSEVKGGVLEPDERVRGESVVDGAGDEEVAAAGFEGEGVGFAAEMTGPGSAGVDDDVGSYFPLAGADADDLSCFEDEAFGGAVGDEGEASGAGEFQVAAKEGVDIDDALFGGPEGEVEGPGVEEGEAGAGGWGAEEFAGDVLRAEDGEGGFEFFGIGIIAEGETSGGTEEFAGFGFESSDVRGATPGEGGNEAVGVGQPGHGGVSAGGVDAEGGFTFQNDAGTRTLATERPGGGRTGETCANNCAVRAVGEFGGGAHCV